MSTPVSNQISRLANQLYRRKLTMGRAPFTLVLGSDVMPLQLIEDHIIMTYGSVDQSQISQLQPMAHDMELRNAWRRVRADPGDLIKSINVALTGVAGGETAPPPGDGYLALASLTQRGYFGLIVTSDITARLEDALASQQMLASQWRTFNNRRFDANELQTALDRRVPPVKIVKVYGDLLDTFAFTPDETKSYAEQLALILGKWLEASLLVVGYNHVRDQWPFSATGGSLHYVHVTPPAPGTIIYQAILARSESNDVLTGPDAAFDPFWQQLRNSIDALEGAASVGVPVSQLPEAQVEKALRTNNPLVDLIGEWQPKKPTAKNRHALVEVPAATNFFIYYDNEQHLSFKIEGALSYESSSRAVLRLDTEGTNRILQFMGRNIATYYDTNDKEGHDAWREQAKREGSTLFEKLFASNPDLMEKLGTARQATGDAENLVLCFTGPRNYLGMPYELLYDREPLAVKHPLCRKITGVPTVSRTFSGLLADLRKIKDPLRVLLIASDTGGIDADGEIQLLADEIRKKTDQLKIKAEIKSITTDEAALGEVEQLLNKCAYDIVHYAGHGLFDTMASENSGLLFWQQRNRQGEVALLPARALAQRLKGSKTLLFYLSACVGATVGGAHLLHNNDYLGVMDAIVQAGVPVVLGYRWVVTDDGAKRFAAEFYRSLFATQSPPQAAFRARREIYMRDANDETWTSPILVAQNL